MDQASGKDGLGTVDVLGAENEHGECSVQVEKLCCWARMASQQPMAAPTPTSCCRLRMGSRLTRLRGRPYLVAASFSCCVVTLLVCSKRTTSLAASWMVGSKVVTHCWISGWFQPSGISSCSVGCGGCKTSVRAGGFGGGGVGAWDGAAGAEDRLVLLTGVSGLPRSWSF